MLPNTLRQKHVAVLMHVCMQVLLYLYEVFMLPLRVAWGTGYGRLILDVDCLAVAQASPRIRRLAIVIEGRA